ncbi:MAG: GGDEF domain-containing protein [Burkholderiales bacterium]|nr:GGDEF domain-containing protein [Burkholderiales bacterium]
MSKLERPRRHADAEILARWQQLRDADAARLDRDSLVWAAWQGRQLDHRWAAGVARAVLDAAAGDDPQDIDAARARGYALLVLGEVESLGGNLAAAAARAAAADAIFAACACAAGRSDCAWLQTWIASDRGDYAARRSAARRSADLAAPDDTERRQAAELAQVCFDTFEDAAQARALHEARLATWLAEPQPALAAMAQLAVSFIDLRYGRYAEAIEGLHRSEQHNEAAGQVRQRWSAVVTRASVWLDLGDHDACLACAQPALDEARRLGWPQLVGRCLEVMAGSMRLLGRHEAASRLADEAVEVLASQRDSKGYLVAVYTASTAALADGRLEAARAGYAMLVDRELAADALELERYALLGIAEVDSAGGAGEAAVRHAERALALARAEGDVPMQVDALRLLARMARRAGVPARSLAHLGDAVELVSEHMDIEHAADLLDDYAAGLSGAGRHAEAVAALRAANQALRSRNARDAAQRAVAIEVRMKTERALAEAEIQRRAAGAEAARAAELEAVNERLQAAQSLLMQRNDQLKQAYARIEDLSLTDPLTGLRNRRFLDQVIAADVAQCVRAHRSSALMGLDGDAAPADADLLFFLVDIDHFKRVNDEHGHAAGDAVLVEFARRLLGVTRDHDHVVRWGGEEFLVAMREADRREAALLAERMRAAVAARPFAVGGRELALSCSIGVAAFPVDATDPLACGWTVALDLADARLYEAKRRGRNCCVDEAGPVSPAPPPRRADYVDSR